MLEMGQGASQADARRMELEKLEREGRMDLRSALELLSLYQRLNMEAHFMGMAGNFMASSNMPADVFATLGQMFGSARKWDLAGAAMRRYLEKNAGNYRAWIDLGCAEVGCGRQAEAMAALTRAVSVGGDPAREILRKDTRFSPLWPRADFKNLVVPPAPVGQPLSPALKPFLRL